MDALLFIVGMLIILTGLFIPLNPIPGLQLSPNVALPILGGFFLVPAIAKHVKR